MTIRPACETDSADIASLLDELGYQASPAQVRARLNTADPRSTLHLVAESGGSVVACLSACLVPYFPDGSTLCRITAMVVSSDYRRAGVGGALVEAAAKYARQQGCSGLEVTSAERRVDAHRFYEGAFPERRRVFTGRCEQRSVSRAARQVLAADNSVLFQDFLLSIGARVLDPPAEYEYTRGYYAVFFSDPDGSQAGGRLRANAPWARWPTAISTPQLNLPSAAASGI